MVDLIRLLDSSEVKDQLIVCARAIANGVKSTGFTTDGHLKLDCEIEGITLSFINQDPDKMAEGIKQAKNNKNIIQVKDAESRTLVGWIDPQQGKFERYQNYQSEPLDIEDIQKSLAAASGKTNR